MKKITVLITLILCVTIGGVYAAWTYTGVSVSSVDITVSHGMASATTEGDKGIMKIISNDATIIVDRNAGDDGKSYFVDMIITGGMTVSYTPNPGAPDTEPPLAEAILITENAEANAYDVDGEDYEIYVYSGTPVDLVWEKQDDGSYLASIDKNDIDELLNFGYNFELKTYEEYTDFHAKEGRITLTVKFQEKAAAIQE